MRTARPRVVAALVIVLAPSSMVLFSPPVAGQAPSRVTPPGPPVAGQPPAPRYDDATIAFQFPGGTVEEYVAVVKGAAGDRLEVNVVLDEEAGAATMPKVELKRVRFEDALQLIQNLARSVSGGPIVFTEVTREPTPVFVLRVEQGALQLAAGLPGGGPPIRVLQNQPAAEKAVQRLEVFSLRDLIETGRGGDDDSRKLTAKTILSAVEQALEQANQASSASVKYHAESYLLMVRGTPGQIDIVRQVLDKLAPVSARARRTGLFQKEGAGGIPVLEDVPIAGDLFRKKPFTADDQEAARDEVMRSRDEAARSRAEVDDLRAVVKKLQDEVQSLRAQLESQGKEGKKP